MKTEKSIGLITKFKFETLERIKTDSLDTTYKLDLLDNITDKFSGQILENSSHVREAIQYLIGVIGLYVAIELVFFIIKIKSDRQKQSR